MTRLAVALAASVTLAALAGCETTQQQSAQIAKRLGHQSAVAVTTHIGAANPYVKIDRLALVHSKAGTAAAVELTNTSPAAQAVIPIVITVDDAAGRVVYTNDTVGTSSPSGELSLLRSHATAWWVDGNVLASGGTPVIVSAKIGAPQAAAPAQPAELTASGLASGSNFVGPVISGTLVNGSQTPESAVTLYAVALVGTRVVAAGQSLVPQIGAHAKTPFQVTLIGSAKGAVPAVTVAPARPD
ncbi:MAG: hypothetical protein ABSG64_01635 [Solirubrobacteraceae bacterium]|jgi:hypothetical protein